MSALFAVNRRRCGKIEGWTDATLNEMLDFGNGIVGRCFILRKQQDETERRTKQKKKKKINKRKHKRTKTQRLPIAGDGWYYPSMEEFCVHYAGFDPWFWVWGERGNSRDKVGPKVRASGYL